MTQDFLMTPAQRQSLALSQQQRSQILGSSLLALAGGLFNAGRPSVGRPGPGIGPALLQFQQAQQQGRQQALQGNRQNLALGNNLATGAANRQLTQAKISGLEADRARAKQLSDLVAQGGTPRQIADRLIRFGFPEQAKVIMQTAAAGTATVNVGDAASSTKRRVIPKTLATRGNLTPEEMATFPEGPPPTPAAQVNISPGETAFAKSFGTKAAGQFFDLKTKAEDAAESLQKLPDARKLLAGAITGTGATWQAGFGNALLRLGIDFGQGDAVANTQAYGAAMATEVARIIKAFGSGTGLSDADRTYAENAAGGKINMTREAINRILDINEKQSRWIIGRYNKQAKLVSPRLDPSAKLFARPIQPPKTTRVRPGQQRGQVAGPVKAMSLEDFAKIPINKMTAAQKKALDALLKERGQ